MIWNSETILDIPAYTIGAKESNESSGMPTVFVPNDVTKWAESITAYLSEKRPIQLAVSSTDWASRTAFAFSAQTDIKPSSFTRLEQGEAFGFTLDLPY